MDQNLQTVKMAAITDKYHLTKQFKMMMFLIESECMSILQSDTLNIIQMRYLNPYIIATQYASGSNIK